MGSLLSWIDGWLLFFYPHFTPLPSPSLSSWTAKGRRGRTSVPWLSPSFCKSQCLFFFFWQHFSLRWNNKLKTPKSRNLASMMEEDLDKESCVTVICLYPTETGARPLLPTARNGAPLEGKGPVTQSPSPRAWFWFRPDAGSCARRALSQPGLSFPTPEGEEACCPASCSSPSISALRWCPCAARVVASSSGRTPHAPGPRPHAACCPQTPPPRTRLGPPLPPPGCARTSIRKQRQPSTVRSTSSSMHPTCTCPWPTTSSAPLCWLLYLYRKFWNQVV